MLQMLMLQMLMLQIVDNVTNVNVRK
jgi:hypothetical protein